MTGALATVGLIGLIDVARARLKPRTNVVAT
jgi:hypothetical protein